MHRYFQKSLFTILSDVAVKEVEEDDVEDAVSFSVVGAYRHSYTTRSCSCRGPKIQQIRSSE